MAQALAYKPLDVPGEIEEEIEQNLVCRMLCGEPGQWQISHNFF